ncbi:MAG: GAP family protein [Mycolicibacterium insubricum]
MTAFLLTLTGLAFLDSLNVLNIGVISAVIYGSRLNRQSVLPGGVSYIGGLLTVTITFGLCVVLGLGLLADLTDFHLTPAVRYWGELVLGVLLIGLAFVPLVAQSTTPGWALGAMRDRPWLLGFLGAAVGLGQAPTAVPYLTALAMIAALHPRPAAWPLMIVGYWIVAMLPCMLILGLSTLKSRRAVRAQRWLVRNVAKYGPIGVRLLFLVVGVALVADALVHRSRWW